MLPLKIGCFNSDTESFGQMEKPSQVKEGENGPHERQYLTTLFGMQILQNLNNLRTNSRMCDVEIHCGGEVIQAHRLILSAGSPYFCAMFSTGLLEEQSRIVELHYIEPDILQTLIDFIYSGNITINQKNVQKILIAADMLQLDIVIGNCTTFLKEQLHVTNAVGIFRFAERLNCKDLANIALEFIYCNFPNVSREEEFVELSKEQLLKLISSEHLHIDSELEVLQAATEWMLHDVSQRRQFIFQLLSHIRFNLVHISLLDRTIQECSDETLKVALRSIRKELATGRRSLGLSSTSPRLDAKKYIFVIGGSDCSITNIVHESVERFDTYQNQWCHVSPMSIGRSSPGVALFNGIIYVVGGERESQVLANVECYDPRTDSWKTNRWMVQPRCEFGFCALDDKLYAFGGCVGDSYGKTIERYDPSLSQWKLYDHLPEPRGGMSAVSYEGLIYLVGGRTNIGPVRKDLMSYNPVTQEWTELSSMQVPRYQPSLAILNGALYVAGGVIHGDDLPSVEKYSFEENQWSRIPEMRIGRRNPAVVAAGGFLYVIGGQEPQRGRMVTVGIVERYNPVTEEWDTCSELNQKRHDAVAIIA